MAVTGVLNGLDRGLITSPDVLIHASGSYDAEDYLPPEGDQLQQISTLEDLRHVLHTAAS